MNSHPNLVSSANWQSRDLHSSPVIFLRGMSYPKLLGKISLEAIELSSQVSVPNIISGSVSMMIGWLGFYHNCSQLWKIGRHA